MLVFHAFEIYCKYGKFEIDDKYVKFEIDDKFVKFEIDGKYGKFGIDGKYIQNDIIADIIGLLNISVKSDENECTVTSDTYACRILNSQK